MDKELSDEEKVKEVLNTFSNFMNDLGPNDIYKKIFLEVLLEEIYNKKVDLTDVFKFDPPQVN